MIYYVSEDPCASTVRIKILDETLGSVSRLADLYKAIDRALTVASTAERWRSHSLNMTGGAGALEIAYDAFDGSGARGCVTGILHCAATAAGYTFATGLDLYGRE